MNITANSNTATLAGFMEGRKWIGHADQREVFDGPVPREKAIELLSYPLAEATLTATVLNEDGVNSFPVTGRKAIVRPDTGDTFGVFKNGYQIHQPVEWCINAADMILDGGMQIATVALTNRGARVLMQAQLPETQIATAPGAEPVAHRPWLSVATSHDGTIATTYGTGTRLLICENELSLPGFRSFVKNLNDVYKVRHTSKSLTKVGEVRQSLGLVAEQVGEEFDKEFRELVSQYVSDSQWDEFVRGYTGVDRAPEGRSKTIAQNKKDALDNLWFNDERAASWRNSKYGIVAALNTAQQWEFGADKGRTERNQNNIITGKRAENDANILKMLAYI